MSYPADPSDAEKAPEHEHAIAVLEEARDQAVQKLEALSGQHRDLLRSADLARSEIAAQEALVDNYFHAIAALSAPAEKLNARPHLRPISDNPQA